MFTQILEFGFKSLRRSDLDKAVGGELEGVVPVDLEDMVYTYEAIPVPVAGAMAGLEVPVAGTQRGSRRTARRGYARADVCDAPRARRTIDRSR